MGEDSPKERLRLRLRELGLPLNGRRSDDISLRKLSQAMGINLQHEDGNRKDRDELVEALVSALLSEAPVLANFHASYVEASLKDLRQIRDGLSGQAEQSGELRERLSKLTIKDQRDHVVTLRDLSRSLELPQGSWMSKADYAQQILTALLAEVPAIASVDDAKTALVDASLRELLALRDGLAGQASQRQGLKANWGNSMSEIVVPMWSPCKICPDLWGLPRSMRVVTFLSLFWCSRSLNFFFEAVLMLLKRLRWMQLFKIFDELEMVWRNMNMLHGVASWKDA